MAHEHDRRPPPLHLSNAVEALALERRVADGERLVDEQDVGVDVHRDGEREPHHHPARIELHRLVDEFADAREAFDVGHRAVHLPSRNAEDRAVEHEFSRPVNSGLNPLPSSSSAATRPCTEMAPSVGNNVPVINCSSVDLPEPLRPTMPTVSPARMSKLTRRSAQNSWKYRRRPRVSVCSRRW